MARASFIVAAAACAAALTACGPSRSVVRQYVQSSPHRAIAVLPFDMVHGERAYAPQATRAMEGRLRAAGFRVIDPRAVEKPFNASKLRNATFDAAAAAADVGARAGADAVLVGAVDEAYEHANNAAASYVYELRPTPACCVAPHPCPRSLVFDPMVNAYVDGCGPVHRRVMLQPARHDRRSGFAVRLRLLDVRTGSVLWAD